MKTFTILPLLAAGTSKNKVSERSYDENSFISEVSKYSEECSIQVPRYKELSRHGGIFETTNLGTSGEISLEKYPYEISCKHDVHANNSCSMIKISYRSISVMMDYSVDYCFFDGFRFGWTDNETGEFNVTPTRCNCFGDGCDLPKFALDFDYANNNNYYDNYQDQHLGPEEITINSNSFTFYFETTIYADGGHVILDWECVEPPTTTTTTTTTEPTTTTTSTTTT